VTYSNHNINISVIIIIKINMTSLFAVIRKNIKFYRKSNVIKLQHAGKLKRKTPDQKEFYDHCKTICKVIKTEYKFSIDEIQKLEKSLMY